MENAEYKNRNAGKAIAICCITLSLLLMLFGSFGVTGAYLIHSEAKKNSLTVGETVTKLKEEYNPPAAVTPGTTFTKKPYMENQGNLACFVRMRVDFSDAKAGMANNAGGFCTLNYNTTDWTYNSTDEYWYYNKILQPGESTYANPLFTTATVSSAVSQTDIINFDIMVYGEATQAGTLSAADYMTVWNNK